MQEDLEDEGSGLSGDRSSVKVVEHQRRNMKHVVLKHHKERLVEAEGGGDISVSLKPF